MTQPRYVIANAVADQMPLVRTIFEEYQQWLGVDLCFQGFARELADLPGCYREPDGFILLALEGNQVCGCVAVRPLELATADTSGERCAELKRLFVRPRYQGSGLGRQLFDRAMQQTRQRGYQAILLDTLPQMKLAQQIYIKHGFTETAAYTENPVEGVKYFKYQFAEDR